jgi:hypothetical protein
MAWPKNAASRSAVAVVELERRPLELVGAGLVMTVTAAPARVALLGVEAARRDVSP